VPYDGAHEVLFTSTSQTVFSQTFMDVMLEMVLTRHSTLSSAASVLCFLLESTDSLSGPSADLSWQTLVAAAHRYGRTLMVPANLFRCGKYTVAGERPYIAIIADGEVLSIIRNQSQPLMPVTEGVSVVPMDANHGSCVPVAAIRAAVRKRLSADRGAVVRLTEDDHAALARFGEELVSVPEAHEAEEQRSSPRAVMWAGVFLFLPFFTNEQAEQLPVVACAAAGVAANVNAAGAGDCGNGGAAADAAAGGGDDPMVDAAGGGGIDGHPGGGHVPHAAGAAGAAGGAGAGSPVFFSWEVDGTLDGIGNEGRPADQWRIVRRFLKTFVAEPVLGVFAGLRQDNIARLAKQLVRCRPVAEW